jgi:non-homologous end joining protein Ku
MKVKGVAPVVPAVKGRAPSKVVDLMEVLKESLKETQSKKAVTAGARTRKAR